MRLYRVLRPTLRTVGPPAPGTDGECAHVGDFTSLEDAHSNAVPGDYVEPIDWNEDTADPVYTNAGDIEQVSEPPAPEAPAEEATDAT